MCLLWSTNWVFISQKTPFFIVTFVKTSNLTMHSLFIFCFTCLGAISFLCGSSTCNLNQHSPKQTFIWSLIRPHLSGNLQHGAACPYNWIGWRRSLYKHSSAEVNGHSNSDGFRLRLVCRQRRTWHGGCAFCGLSCSLSHLSASVAFSPQVNRSPVI
jgi:hypothetical protein